MSLRQNINAHLERFASNIGLDTLGLNELDACSLCFDDTMVVSIEFLEGSDSLAFVATAAVINAATDERAELHNKLLQINLQHNNMVGAFLALNQDSSEALLIRSVPASLDFLQFEALLEKFVNTLEWVMEEIKHGDSQPSASDSHGQLPHKGGAGGIKV